MPLDLSGNDKEATNGKRKNHHRYDVPVLIYIANSFWNATKTLEEKINNSFEVEKDCYVG